MKAGEAGGSMLMSALNACRSRLKAFIRGRTSVRDDADDILQEVTYQLMKVEPRAITMKMGICKDDLAPSLGRADEVFLLQPQHIPWQVAEVADACIQPAHWSADVDALADMVVRAAQPGDHILVMSNGGFGGIHQKLLDGLAKKAEAAAAE